MQLLKLPTIFFHQLCLLFEEGQGSSLYNTSCPEAKKGEESSSRLYGCKTVIFLKLKFSAQLRGLMVTIVSLLLNYLCRRILRFNPQQSFILHVRRPQKDFTDTGSDWALMHRLSLLPMNRSKPPFQKKNIRTLTGRLKSSGEDAFEGFFFFFLN